jgi:hypothetical protein
MPLSVTGSRVQEASHGTCPVQKPAAGPAAILSPDDGHGAASGYADAGHSFAPPGGLSRGGAARSAGVSPAAAGGSCGAPRVYAEASLLLLALLRTVWRRSYRETHDWLVAWPTLAMASGLPLGRDGRPQVPRPAQQSKRLRAAGAPPSDTISALVVVESTAETDPPTDLLDAQPQLSRRYWYHPSLWPRTGHSWRTSKPNCEVARSRTRQPRVRLGARLAAPP